MELEKNKQRVLVFGYPYCWSFNAEHENTCPFPCDIGSYIPTFWDMCLHVIVQTKTKKIYNFLYTIHQIYVYQIYTKQQLKKTLFHFSSLQYLNSETR